MDFATINAGVAAVKSGLDVVKIALGLAKDAKDLLPSGDQKDQVGAALETATRKLAEGEAAVAASLGYKLCLCEFPPTPMLRVGHIRISQLSGMDKGPAMERNGGGMTGSIAVHECPKCKQTDAPSYPNFARDRP